VLEDRWVPSPAIVVNNPTDTPVVGQTDLRQAIAQANAANLSDGDQTIVFDPTVFNTPQTITLKSGQLELSDKTGTTTITGPAGDGRRRNTARIRSPLLSPQNGAGGRSPVRRPPPSLRLVCYGRPRSS
jgi:hypothetical protein